MFRPQDPTRPGLDHSVGSLRRALPAWWWAWAGDAPKPGASLHLPRGARLPSAGTLLRDNPVAGPQGPKAVFLSIRAGAQPPSPSFEHVPLRRGGVGVAGQAGAALGHGHKRTISLSALGQLFLPTGPVAEL